MCDCNFIYIFSCRAKQRMSESQQKLPVKYTLLVNNTVVPMKLHSLEWAARAVGLDSHFVNSRSSYSSYGLFLGLIKWFWGAFTLFKIVFITFNVIKTIYPSFYEVEWRLEWRILPLKIRVNSSRLESGLCVLATISTLSVLKLAS